MTFHTKEPGVDWCIRSPRPWSTISPGRNSVPPHTGSGPEFAGNVTKESCGARPT